MGCSGCVGCFSVSGAAQVELKSDQCEPLPLGSPLRSKHGVPLRPNLPEVRPSLLFSDCLLTVYLYTSASPPPHQVL